MGKERDSYFKSLRYPLGYKKQTTIQIGARTIGARHPSYIIAEVGANHHSKIENALELIDEAKKAGADAVKFQHLRAKTIAADTPIDITWHGKSGWKNFSDFYSNSELPYEWTKSLIEHCRKQEIEFLSTPFDQEAVALLDQANVAAYKVASYELTDDLLLRSIAKTKRPVIVSTGMAYLEEVAHAIGVLQKQGATQIAVLHCTSIYPPRQFSDLNLRAITTLRNALHLPIGYSDHSPPGSLAAALGAVSLGACIIEKHITLARDGGSHDDPNSIVPNEFKNMVQEIRLLEQALYHSGIKQPVVYENHEGDEIFDRYARRSLYAACDIPAGTIINESHVITLRPWGGIEPKHWELIVGKKTLRPIQARKPLQWPDFMQT